MNLDSRAVMALVLSSSETLREGRARLDRILEDVEVCGFESAEFLLDRYGVDDLLDRNVVLSVAAKRVNRVVPVARG